MLDVTNIATYRYFTADLLTGAVIMEIPFGQVSWERKISTAGSFSGTISADPNEDHFDLYDTTMPGKYALYVLRDDVCVWGGIIWSRDYSIMDKKLTVSALEFTSYLYHRILWKTMTIPSDGTTNIASLISDLLNSTLTDQLAIDEPISYLASDTYSLVTYVNKANFTSSTTLITEEAHGFVAGDSIRIRNVGGSFDADLATIASSPAPTDYTFSLSDNLGPGVNFVAGGVAGTLRTSTDAVSWVTRTSNFGSSEIRSISSARNLLVAVGDGGQIRASTNATTWVTRTSSFGNSIITAIAYGNGLWVAGDSVGRIGSSTDSITWITQTSNFGGVYITTVAYGNGIWVAGGLDTQIRTSTDAITWVTRVSNFGSSSGTGNRIFSVSYGNGIWVAGGIYGILRSSTDTINWVTQESNFGTLSINSVAYGNGVWTAVGSTGTLRTSTDAVTWVTQISNFGATAINSVAYGNGVWTAVGSTGTLRTSTDAVTWVTQISNFGATAINSVSTNFPYPLGTNIATPSSVGAYAIKKSTFDTLQSSSNLNISIDTSTSQFTELKDYTLVGSGDNNPFTFRGSEMKYVGEVLQNFANNGVPSFGIKTSNVFVVFGDSGSLLTSTDAITWVTRTSNFGASTIYAVAYGNGLFVATGGPAQVRTSTDAVTWVTRNSNIIGVHYDVKYGNALWVAGGSGGEIRTSADGITWVTRVSNFGLLNINAVAHNELTDASSLWVVGGAQGTIRTSTDAITWVTRVSNFGTTIIEDIAYGNGIWVAGGQGGTLRRSTDAITWTTQNPNFGTSSILTTGFGNGTFVAGGGFGSGAATLATSTDAITWVTRTTNFTNSFVNSVVYSNGTWVAVGNDIGNDELRTSTDAITWVTQVDVFAINPSVGAGLAPAPDYTRKNTRFDYYIESSFDTATETFSNEFKAWLVRKDTNDPLQGVEAAVDLTQLYGPSGFGANGLVFEHPGNIVNITLGESAETASTRTWVMDSSNDLGSEAEKYYASYTNLNYLGYSWPLLESAVTGRDLPASKDTDVLPYAKAIGYRLSPPIGQYNVTVNGSLEPTVGTYKPGDWCVVVVGDQFVNNRLKPPYENRQDILVRKIKSFKVSVPDNPQFPEVVDLELVPEWEAPE